MKKTSPWAVAFAWALLGQSSIVAAAPATPVLSLPANAATKTALTPSLSWTSVTGAATYYVQASTSSAFATIRAQDSTITAASYTPATLDENITYYWRVSAKNSTGVSAWAAAWHFTTLRPADKFLFGSYTTPSGTLKYRLFVPAIPDTSKNSAKKYPIILTLHGIGECGTDDSIHINNNRLAEIWAEDTTQAKQRCFVLSPQCPGPSGSYWTNVISASNTNVPFFSLNSTAESWPLQAALGLMDSVIRQYPIDTNRQYITGLSLGGFGTWEAIMRFPNRFAAAVPMSSGCDTSKAATVKNVPIWCFHGAVDPTVSHLGEDTMFAKLAKLVIPTIRYTCGYSNYFSNSTIARNNLAVDVDSGYSHTFFCDYTDGTHQIWVNSYNDPLLATFVFMHSKAPSVGIITPSGNSAGARSNHALLRVGPQSNMAALCRNLAPGGRYEIKVFDASGVLHAHAIVNGTITPHALGQMLQGKTFGVRLVEIKDLEKGGAGK